MSWEFTSSYQITHLTIDMFESGSKSNSKVASSSLVIAVDLGFSQNSASTGVAWRSDRNSSIEHGNFTFAQAVSKTQELMSGCKAASLILEAPLSATFNNNGNPAVRSQFERRYDEAKQRNVSRPWYSGPGAATLIAALFFLRRIQAPSEFQPGAKFLLFEGFHTFKQSATSHEQDAIELPNAFYANEIHEVDESTGSWLSILSLIGDENDESVPAIVVPVPSGAVDE